MMREAKFASSEGGVHGSVPTPIAHGKGRGHAELGARTFPARVKGRLDYA